MEFKKFIEFISEKKKPNKKDIQDVMPEKPISGYPEKSVKTQIIDATEDYYDAKMPLRNPKGKVNKPEDKKFEEE
jgi:hypothetical protein